MTHSTRSAGGKKPRAKKPKFSLWLHASGQWGKKIRGKSYYFGIDQEKALEEYTRVRAALEAGLPYPAPVNSAGVSLLRLVNTFLTFKKSLVQSGELTLRMFNEYHDTAERLLDHFGKETAVDQLRPEDLVSYRVKLAERYGPYRLVTEITRDRTILSFAFTQKLIDKPVDFGEFKQPKKRVIRKHRATTRGTRLFERDELRLILDSVDPLWRAMVLLGLNCGFGNADVGTLPKKALDLSGGWIDFPRGKTGISRRCPLWQETIAALRKALELRPSPSAPEHDALVFLTSRGNPWHDDAARDNPLSAEFAKILRRLKLKRPGLAFYALRHTLQTIGEEPGDQTAVKLIMGHCDDSMADVYRERFSDARLQRVVAHVHDWLFGADGGKDGAR